MFSEALPAFGCVEGEDVAGGRHGDVERLGGEGVRGPSSPSWLWLRAVPLTVSVVPVFTQMRLGLRFRRDGT